MTIIKNTPTTVIINFKKRTLMMIKKHIIKETDVGLS